VKAAFLGIEKKPEISHSLLWVVKQHHAMNQKILKPGTMKNYKATEAYLNLFLATRYKVPDMPLKELNYEFISGFEYFIRNNALKENDTCTTNGTMKHLERLKKMVTWAVKNEWVERNPFTNFRLKFKHTEREYLSDLELATMENQDFERFRLQKENLARTIAKSDYPMKGKLISCGPTNRTILAWSSKSFCDLHSHDLLSPVVRCPSHL